MTIKECNKKYFEIIESYFEPIYSYMQSWDLDYTEMESFMLNYPEITDIFFESTESLLEDLKDFWIENIDVYKSELSSSNLLKCIYSGDLSPKSLPDFIKKTALYVDTIIIPDTIFNLSMSNFRQGFTNRNFYLGKLIKHVCNIMQTKKLFLADTDAPIVSIFPINVSLVKEKKSNKLFIDAETKTIHYLNEINLIKGEGNIRDILDRLDDTRDALSIYKSVDIKKLPTKMQSEEEFKKFIAQSDSIQTNTSLGRKSTSWYLGQYFYSQFLRCEEHSYFVNLLEAEPIYDYQLAWEMYNIAEYGVQMDGAIINALQKPTFEWISGLPLEVILRIREENHMPYLRRILRDGLTDIKCSKDKSLETVATKIAENIRIAQEKQKKDLEDIVKRNKEVNKEFLFSSAESILGLFPAISEVVSVLGIAKDVKDYKSKVEKLDEEREVLESCPVNLLLTQNGEKH